MNLQELIEAVYVETKRPDLVRTTLQTVQASTMKMHGMDFFYRDMRSALVNFDIPAYLQVLDTSVMPRFRSIAYMRKWDPAYLASQLSPLVMPPIYNSALGQMIYPNNALAFLEILDPDDILDNYGMEKTDVAYGVGSSIMIKSSTSLSQALFGWYEFPDVREATFNSWIAEKYPYAIVYDAASAILSKGGSNEESRKYDSVNPINPGLVQAQIHLLLTSNVTMKGY